MDAPHFKILFNRIRFFNVAIFFVIQEGES